MSGDVILESDIGRMLGGRVPESMSLFSHLKSVQGYFFCPSSFPYYWSPNSEFHFFFSSLFSRIAVVNDPQNLPYDLCHSRTLLYVVDRSSGLKVNSALPLNLSDVRAPASVCGPLLLIIQVDPLADLDPTNNRAEFPFFVDCPTQGTLLMI